MRFVRTGWSRALLLAAALLAPDAATAQAPAPGLAVTHPVALEIGVPSTFRFSAKGERHFFRIVPPATGALGLEILASPAGQKAPWWRWLDEAGKELRGHEADVAVASDAPVILEVRSADWEPYEYASPDPVRLRVGFRPRSADDALGLDLAAPRALAIGEEPQFTFFVRRERRFFRIVPPATGALGVEILAAPKDKSAPWWRWLDEAGKVLRGHEADLAVAAGTPVILEVASSDWASNEYTSADPVRLRVGFKPRSEDDAKGLELATPRALTIDEEAGFSFFVRRERHFFRIVPPATGALGVEILASPAGQRPPWWHWLDEAGKELRGHEADLAVASGVPVILEVASSDWASNEYTSPDPVRLRIGFKPRSEEDAKGLALTTPRALAIGEEARFTFFVRNERRFFRIVPPASGALGVEILSSPANQRAPWWHWLDEAGKELRGHEADLAVASGVPVILEVASSDWAANEYASADPVRLRVGFKPRSTDDAKGLELTAPRALAIGEEARFSFFVRREHRFFRIVPPAMGALGVEILASPADQRAPWWRWLDEAGKELRGHEADMAVASGMPAILEVASSDWAAKEYTSPDPVRLRVGFKPRSTDDARGLELAAPWALAIDEEARFTFFVRREHRFFRVVSPAAGALRVEMLASPAGQPAPWWRWLNEAGQEIARPGDSPKVDAGAALILEVASSDWAAREYASSDPVRLRVRHSSWQRFGPKR